MSRENALSVDTVFLKFVRQLSHACNLRKIATRSKVVALKFGIDWSGLRAAAVALENVNEAAKRAASVLPEAERQRFIERVNKRSQREKWIAQANATAPVVANEKPLSKNVQRGSKVVADAILDHSRATRLELSKTALNGAKEFARKTGKQVIDNAKKLRDLTAAAAQVGGWDQSKSAGVQFKLLQIGGTLTLVSEGQGGSDQTLDD